jgi:phosphoribosylamine---glycine ligase
VKILWISLYGESASLAFRAKLEGNNVRLYIKEPSYRKDIYEGLIDKLDDWKLSVSWCDFIVFDSNPLYDIWEQVHKIKPCYGGSTFGETLEHDRELSHQIMKKLDINSPESETYDKITQVYKHLKAHKVPHAVKPFGPQVQSEHIIIGQYSDNSDSIGLLERFEEEKIPFEGIEVEEKINGIEVGYSCWFNGKDWVWPVNVNFQHKPFCSGDYGNGIGFLTGEMGTALKYTEDQENIYFKDTLDKIKPLLKANDYRGQMDLGLIVDQEGKPWALEFTPRNGTPSQFIEYQVQKMDIAELYNGLAKGTIRQNDVSLDWAVGVVVVTPGFPDAKTVKKKSAGTPIFGISKDNSSHIHLYEAMKKDNKLVTTQGIGYPMCVVNSGTELKETIQGVYSILDKRDGVYVPNSWYRDDIGQRVLDQMPMINQLGIL